MILKHIDTCDDAAVKGVVAFLACQEGFEIRMHAFWTLCCVQLVFKGFVKGCCQHPLPCILEKKMDALECNNRDLPSLLLLE